MSLLTPYFINAPLHALNYCTLLLMCGIAASTYFSLSLLAILCFVIVIPISLYLQRLPIALLFLASFMTGAWRYQTSMENHLEFSQRMNNKPFKMRGVILSIEPQDHPRMKQKMTINAYSFTPEGESEYETQRTIQIYLSKRTDAKVADKIEIDSMLLKKNKNPSYEQYLIKEQISATLFLPALDYTLISRPTISFTRWLFYFKENLLYRCKKKLSRATFSFFSSVFLGNRMQEKKQMEKPKNNCKTWGISHYLARSGLHMVIFICIWYFILNLLPISFRLKQIILIGIGLVYHFLSWPSISFIRALYSFLLFKSCTLLKVPSQLLHLLTIVTIVVLVHNPMQLFFLDFQLSFGLTFALAWFNHVAIQQSFLAAKC